MIAIYRPHFPNFGKKSYFQDKKLGNLGFFRIGSAFAVFCYNCNGEERAFAFTILCCKEYAGRTARSQDKRNSI
jgi:hypothetical protein